MTDRIQHFLLVFDHRVVHLIRSDEFGDDAVRALAAYASTEAEYGDRREIEVVLIGSDSFETVKRTHANYFDGSVAVLSTSPASEEARYAPWTAGPL